MQAFQPQDLAKPDAVTAGILHMIDTVGYGLRDMRDIAILLIGYMGGLRRSEIVSPDFGRDDTELAKAGSRLKRLGNPYPAWK